MSAPAEARPLADVVEDALVRLDAEFQRRALGARPWTVGDYYEKQERLRAQYKIRAEWLRRHPEQAS